MTINEWMEGMKESIKESIKGEVFISCIMKEVYFHEKM